MSITLDVPLIDARAAAAPAAYPQLHHVPQRILAQDFPILWARQTYPPARPLLAAELAQGLLREVRAAGRLGAEVTR
jgi:hypothetical protein